MKEMGCWMGITLGLLALPLLIGGTDPVAAQSISNDQVNIRSGPNLSSAIVFTVPKGYPVVVEKEDNNWAYFHDWQGNTGWVYKPLVSELKTVIILVDKANIRSTASLGSSVVKQGQIGEIYQVMAQEGNWIKLGYYNTTTTVGWIRDDLVFGE